MNRTYALLAVFVLIILFSISVLLKNRREQQQQSASTTSSQVQESKPTPTDLPTEVSSGITFTELQPLDKTTVTTPTILVKGNTAPNAEVFINDTPVRATSTGAFALSVVLDEGENTIDIAANDSEGNYAEKELTITYQPLEQ